MTTIERYGSPESFSSAIMNFDEVTTIETSAPFLGKFLEWISNKLAENDRIMQTRRRVLVALCFVETMKLLSNVDNLDVENFEIEFDNYLSRLEDIFKDFQSMNENRNHMLNENLNVKRSPDDHKANNDQGKAFIDSLLDNDKLCGVCDSQRVNEEETVRAAATKKQKESSDGTSDSTQESCNDAESQNTDHLCETEIMEKSTVESETICTTDESPQGVAAISAPSPKCSEATEHSFVSLPPVESSAPNLSQLPEDEETTDVTTCGLAPKPSMEVQEEESIARTACHPLSIFNEENSIFPSEENMEEILAKPNKRIEMAETAIRSDGTGCISGPPQHQGRREEFTKRTVCDEATLTSSFEEQEEGSDGAGLYKFSQLYKELHREENTDGTTSGDVPGLVLTSKSDKKTLIDANLKSSYDVENPIPSLSNKRGSETVDVINGSRCTQVEKEESIDQTISHKTVKSCPDAGVQRKETGTKIDTETSLCSSAEAQKNGKSGQEITTRATSKSHIEMMEQQSQDEIISDTGANSCLEMWRKEGSDGTNTAANPKFHGGVKNPAFRQPNENEKISALIAENMKKKATKSETIGKEGGEIALYGCSVLFPKDAVKEEIEFQLHVDNNPKHFSTTVTSITPILGLKPHMEFGKAVTVAMRTCYSATDEGEVPTEIWSQEKGEDWKFSQQTTLKLKNQVQFKTRSFSNKIAIVTNADSETGEYHLLNDLYIQQGTAAIASVFCQDPKTQRDCEKGFLKKDYVKLLPYFEEVSCTIDSILFVTVDCELPKIDYRSKPHPAKFKFTKKRQRKQHIALDFFTDNFPKEYSGNLRVFYSVSPNNSNNDCSTEESDDIEDETQVRRTLSLSWPIKKIGKETANQPATNQATVNILKDITANTVTAPAGKTCLNIQDSNSTVISQQKESGTSV